MQLTFYKKRMKMNEQQKKMKNISNGIKGTEPRAEKNEGKRE